MFVIAAELESGTYYLCKGTQDDTHHNKFAWRKGNIHIGILKKSLKWFQIIFDAESVLFEIKDFHQNKFTDVAKVVEIKDDGDFR